MLAGVLICVFIGVNLVLLDFNHHHEETDELLVIIFFANRGGVEFGPDCDARKTAEIVSQFPEFRCSSLSHVRQGKPILTLL